MNVLDLVAVLATKFAERGVIDRATRHQPHEINGVFDVIFDRSRTAGPPNQREQQHFAQHAGVNGRLAAFAVVRVFPSGPVQPIQNLKI